MKIKEALAMQPIPREEIMGSMTAAAGHQP